jgi:hypothetical protein
VVPRPLFSVDGFLDDGLHSLSVFCGAVYHGKGADGAVSEADRGGPEDYQICTSMTWFGGGNTYAYAIVRSMATPGRTLAIVAEGGVGDCTGRLLQVEGSALPTVDYA